MKRVTFGVSSSPSLAVQTLPEAAADYGQEYPNAQYHIANSFYVDDLLGGSDTVGGALALYDQLCKILTRRGFTLRKFRSNSAEVLSGIPGELVELMPNKELVDCHSSSYPKALGVAWDSVKDTMSTDVSTQGKFAPTKRAILSDVSKTFDVLGWITPVILPMKRLFQELWQLKVDWDDPLPENLKLSHQIWREELPLLADLELSRCYYLPEASLSVQLHGFSDASEKAYAAVVYLRSTYQNSPPTCRLVVAKSRVAPLKQRTIPELELCGAVVLTDLLESTQNTLDLATEQVTAWSDSTIVLCWLQNSSARYKTFVANRITSATNHFPPSMWYHVPTEENPADCASRGMSARELREHELWWSGPPWLKLDPVAVPKQPQKADLESLQDQGAKPNTCMLLTSIPTVWLAHRCRSYNKLVKVTAWVHRAYYNFSAKIHHHPLKTNPHLSVEEVSTSEIFLIKRSQRRTFPKQIRLLTASPPKSLPLSSHIISLHPFSIGITKYLCSILSLSITQKAVQHSKRSI